MTDVLLSDPTQAALSDKEQELVIAVTHLMSAGNKLNISENTRLEGSQDAAMRSNKHIIRFAFEIYKVWSALFPQERKEFIESTIHELDIERPVKAALKAGGYTPIAFPTRLDSLFHSLMPSVKTQDKRFWKPLLYYIPELKRSNYA